MINKVYTHGDGIVNCMIKSTKEKKHVNYTNIFSHIFTILTLFLFIFIFVDLFYNDNSYFNTLSKQMTVDDLKSYKSISCKNISNDPFDLSIKQFEVYLKKNFESYTFENFNWSSTKKSNYVALKPDEDITFYIFFDNSIEKINNIKLVASFKAPDAETSVSKSVMLMSKNKIDNAISAVISSLDIKKYYKASLLTDKLKDDKSLELNNYKFNFNEYVDSKLVIVEVY